MKKKKILVLSGVSRSLINFRRALLEEMVLRGYTVIAAAPIDENFEEVSRMLSNIKIKLIKLNLKRNSINPFNDIKFYIDLLQLCVFLKPDIIFAYNAKLVIYSGLVVRKLNGIQFYPMITGLGYAFTEGVSLKRKVLKLIMSSLYRLGMKSAAKVKLLDRK
jgi:hypothetical protein